MYPQQYKNSTNIKTWINDLRLVSSAIRAADMQVATIGAVDYATALDGLSLKQAQLMLTTQGIVGEEQKQILIQQGLIASSDRISASLVSEALANNGLNKEKQEELLIDLGLMNSKTKELITENAVTESKLRAILAEKGIKGAKADTLVASILQTGQNTKEAISWDVLTTSIKNTTKSLIAFLTTNPLGIAMLAIGIGSAIAAVYDALHTSAEEAKENLEESVSAYESVTEEIKSLETELKTCTERLEELQKLADNGTISVANEEELELLKEQNEELERKIALKQAEQIQKQKDVIEDAQDSLGATVDSKYKTGGSDNSTYAVDVTPAEEMKLAMKAYKEATDYLANPNVSKGIRSTYEGFQKDASYRITEMYNLISPTIDAYDKLIEAGYTLTSTEQKQYDELKASEDAYLLYNYNLNKTIEAFRALNEEEQQNILLERLKKQGLTDEQANAVLNNISEENYDEVWDKDFSFTPPEMTDTTTAEEYGKAYAEAWLAGIDEIIQKDDDKFEDSRTKMISSINDMSEGFEELDKIYASIKDEDPFDFKLLDDDNFKETFGELDTYADFIEQITNNSDDIEACQSAFNNLVTEWINEIGILDNVTEENQKLTVAMLKQMGVSNAEEVATKALEKSKTKLAAEEEFLTKKKEDATITSENLTAATYAEVYALWSESTASEATQQYLAQLALSKLDVQNIKLNTKSDIDNIIALAKAAGTSAEYVNALQSALSSLQSASKASATNTSKNYLTTGTQLDAKINNKAWSEELKAAQEQENKIKQAQQELQNVLSSIQNVSLNPSDFYASVDYTGGSKSNGGSGSSSKDTQEQFDWIEIAISRLQRTITNLGKTVSATWKSWSERNSALSQEISAVTSEINLQANAANKYLSLANSVGLGEGYKSLVRNGALDISTITDKNTINAIKQYQEYYQNYLSALDAKQDAEDELANLKQTSFDSIITQYEDQLAFIEHDMSILESTADILENKGYIASASIYDKLIQQEDAKISSLEAKYKALTNELASNGIQQGTEQWNDMKLEILEVEEAILESRNALVEYNNTLQELDWEVFDKLQEKISSIVEEADFLIELMSDEKMFDEGKITEHGQATLGLHALNYKTYMAQAEEFAKELSQIEEELANDPYNQTLLERKNELLETQRDSILAAEDEKQSIKDLVSEGYDNLLSTMDEIIDKRKEMLNQIQDMYEYEKNIAELTKEVTTLEKQEIAFRGDDSESGKAKYQQIKVSLEEARQNLEETEREKTISDIEKMLDTLRDETEQFTSERLDNLDGLIADVIAQTETNTDSILKTLETETTEVGTTLTSEMEKIWGTNGTFTTSLNSVVDMFKQYFDNLQKEADAKAKAVVSSTPSGGSSGGSTTTVTATPAPSTSSSSSNSSSGWGSWFVSKTYSKQNLHPETSIVDRLKYKSINADFSYRSQYYRAMGGSGVYTGSASQNRWMLAQMKSHGFAQGGTIGNLIKATGEDGFVLARKGEGILTPENMKMLENVMVTMNPIVDSLAKLPSLPDMQSRYSGNTSVGDVSITFDLPNVKNYSEFMTQMQNDPKFEGMILHMAFGKNSMDKYKYKWN